MAKNGPENVLPVVIAKSQNLTGYTSSSGDYTSKYFEYIIDCRIAKKDLSAMTRGNFVRSLGFENRR